MTRVNVLQFICPSGFYGAERWIMALARNLKPDRVKCLLAVTDESGHQNLEILDRFGELGLESHRIKMGSRFDIRVILKLVRLIRKKRIHIIHTHGYKSDIIGLVAARLAGIRSVSTPHGFGVVNDDFKLRMFARIGYRILRYFDKIVPLSEEIEGEINRLKIPSARVRLILNGVDLDEIESLKTDGGPDYFRNEDAKIVYVGRLDTGKNIHELIHSFDLLYKEIKNVRLVIIGDGTHRQALERLAGGMSSRSRIEFMGYRKDRLVLLKECDIFSMTSVREGIPRCLMEAMAMGLPVVAYDIPGVDTLVTHRKTGLTTQPGNIEGIKDNWKLLINDKAVSKTIAANGKDHVFETFSASRMAAEYSSLFLELTQDSAGG